jgi:hypothetical protein
VTRKSKLLIGTLFSVLLLSPLLCLVFYDLLYFQPYADRVHSTYLRLPDDERDIPASVVTVIRRAEGPNLGYHLSLRLREDLKVPHRDMMEWHIQSLMWPILLRLHLSEKQRMTLYCHYLLFEQGIGLKESANYHFRKSMGDLTEDEVLTLLTIDLAPRNYSPILHPDRFNEGFRRLKDRYNRASD